MVNIMFVCHGNICRSPMAEFVMKDLVKKKGMELSFNICSSATSMEEIGSGVHYGTRDKLKKYGITTEGKYSVQFNADDYEKYDYIVAMDGRNISNIYRILGGENYEKVSKLLDFTDRKGDIADPWYTGNFDETYNDIYEGSEALIKYIIKNDADKL
ncbi:MAG: low molecular weight protein-tyrosine-phosphatase [Oscillospiraceae bacterium]